MTWQENLFSNLLTIAILGGLALIVYLKYTRQTLGDLFREIRDFMREGKEEVSDHIYPRTFEDIR